MTATLAEPGPAPPTTRRRAPTPPVRQLAGYLAAAKGDGAPFDEAWPAALRAIRWPACSKVTALDRAAIDATRAEWRAAYLGEPTPVAPVIEALLLHLGRAGQWLPSAPWDAPYGHERGPVPDAPAAAGA